MNHPGIKAAQRNFCNLAQGIPLLVWRISYMCLVCCLVTQFLFHHYLVLWSDMQFIAIDNRNESSELHRLLVVVGTGDRESCNTLPKSNQLSLQMKLKLIFSGEKLLSVPLYSMCSLHALLVHMGFPLVFLLSSLSPMDMKASWWF